MTARNVSRPALLLLLLATMPTWSASLMPVAPALPVQGDESVVRSNLTKDELDVAMRCSHAADIALLALTIEPKDAEARSGLIVGIADDKRLAEQLGGATPTLQELVMAHSTVEAMVKNHGAPKTNRDIQVASAMAGAVCALHSVHTKAG